MENEFEAPEYQAWQMAQENGKAEERERLKVELDRLENAIEDIRERIAELDTEGA